ncbi:MAG: hypothetical protein R3C02_17290 [Planctomycetaceae bacterium]
MRGRGDWGHDDGPGMERGNRKPHRGRNGLGNRRDRDDSDDDDGPDDIDTDESEAEVHAPAVPPAEDVIAEALPIE